MYLVDSRHRLRSASTSSLTLQRPSALLQSANRLFRSTVPVWNDLPLDITSAPSLSVFRQPLKTFLFRRFYPDTTLHCRASRSNDYYLGYVKPLYDNDDDDNVRILWGIFAGYICLNKLAACQNVLFDVRLLSCIVTQAWVTPSTSSLATSSFSLKIRSADYIRECLDQ